MTRRAVPGTTYLLHLDPPYRHARHYLGFAEGGPDDLADRLAEHGGPHGARLLAVAYAAGHDWHLARTWPGTTRATERQIKNTRHVPHYCPDCQPQRSASRRTARKTTTGKDTNAMPTTETDFDCCRTPVDSPAQAERERETTAGRAGFDDAGRTVTAQYAGGLDLDAIAAHHDDVSASLLADAQTVYGRAYAAEYSQTAASLVADLREDQAAAQGRSQAACTKPDGTPHPDPRLAARGWQADHGIYQRTGQARQQLEAG